MNTQSELSPASRIQIVETFRRRRWLVLSILAVYAVLAVIPQMLDWPNVAQELRTAYVTVIVLTGVPLLWKWRCPGCNHRLTLNLTAKFCPHCGVPFVA